MVVELVEGYRGAVWVAAERNSTWCHRATAAGKPGHAEARSCRMGRAGSL